MKDIFWKYFTETGNIELYLEYKKHCAAKNKNGGKGEDIYGRNHKNKGSGGAGGSIQGQ